MTNAPKNKGKFPLRFSGTVWAPHPLIDHRHPPYFKYGESIIIPRVNNTIIIVEDTFFHIYIELVFGYHRHLALNNYMPRYFPLSGRRRKLIEERLPTGNGWC
jgi:hypothetical protein